MDKLVYIVLEKMICDNRGLVKHKNGKPVFLASKVFKEVWRDRVFQEIYIDLCMEKHPFHICRDRGALIVRNILVKIVKTYSSPLARFLENIMFYGSCTEKNLCREIVEQYARQETVAPRRHVSKSCQ